MKSKPAERHFELCQKLWGLHRPLEFFRRVENFIYMSEVQNGRPVVVRMTEPRRRTLQQIESELDWQLFLAERGVNCARPLPSKYGRLVESLENEEATFFTCVFEKAPGVPVRQPSDFEPDIMRAWGKTLARMHRHTRDYVPGPQILRRPDWDDCVEPALEQEILRDAQSKYAQRYLALKHQMNQMLRDPSSYGLVHTDLHSGNFHWSQGEIWAFDFDDATYHWYLYDLAVPLFYLRFLAHRNPGQMKMDELEAAYLEGYQEELQAKPDRQQIEDFITYRALIMYGWSQNQLRLQILSEDSLRWCQHYLDWLATLPM